MDLNLYLGVRSIWIWDQLDFASVVNFDQVDLLKVKLDFVTDRSIKINLIQIGFGQVKLGLLS